jgi:GT2 family glycosyltransferase
MMGSGTPFPAEDVDAAARASRAGWAGTYCPNLVVSHHHGRKAGPDIARLYRQYDIGRGAYHVKLLLHGDVMSFLRGIYGLRWRWPHNFATPFREFYGSILYCVYAVTKR